ncbi:MAG: hypothetical protein RL685_7789 [Pseudomonadota bacterium]|jgi:hypothetical protein
MSQRQLVARLASSALLLGAVIGSGCAPLTFSNEASVDYAQYPSVTVEVAGPDGSQRQRDYLENELREHSGFQRVSGAAEPVAGALPAEGASAQLLVEITLDSSYDVDLFDDDDLDVEVTYSASVHYRLFADGTLLDSGAESVEDESTSLDAAEEALDRVVLHYLRPYRF